MYKIEKVIDKILITVAYASVWGKSFMHQQKLFKTLQCDRVFRLVKKSGNSC